jgi:hypothetical protein
MFGNCAALMYVNGDMTCSFKVLRPKIGYAQFMKAE